MKTKKIKTAICKMFALGDYTALCPGAAMLPSSGQGKRYLKYLKKKKALYSVNCAKIDF